MKNIITILTIFTLTVLITSCCPECKECLLTVKYEWKIPNTGFDIINFDRDRLIASEVDYKDNPNGFGNVQYVKDSGHYIIDKITGSITDTIFGFIPKTAEKKYLWLVGQTEEDGLFFGTKTSKFTIANDYKGYKIVLQERYRNIRESNNQVNSVLIFKDNKQIGKSCLPRIFDFTYDKNSVYIYSDTEIYKFSFDQLIKLDSRE